ncbi:MAG: putative acyl esterase [Glaciecola sp.]|jgi:predicted acyl esterase
MFLRSRLAAPLLGAAMVIGVVVSVPTSASAQAPAGYEFTDVWYPSFDGTAMHAGVYLPADRDPGEKHPVIVSITPYTSPNGGATGAGVLSSEQPVRFPELFEHPAFAEGRYAYVAVDVRGFGGSGGCFQYYGQNEFQDTKSTIDWAGTTDWSSGKVALWGKSYDAAQEVLALGSGSEYLAAAVIQAPGLSGYTALWHNGVHYATGRYATTSVYFADDLFPPASSGSVDDPDYLLSNVDGQQDRAACAQDWQSMNVIGDRDDPYWADREPYTEALGSSVPTFWHNGFFDANTKPVGLDIWESLTGPKQAWWGQWTHVRGHESSVGREGFLDESFRFMDEHVRGVTPAVADPAISVQSGGPDGEWRSEAQWPPADAETWTMTLNTGSYLDEPEATSGGPTSGSGIWSTTPELPYDVHLAGETVLHLQANTTVPGAHLVVRMYDLDESGAGVLATRSAYALGGPGEDSASIALYPQDWVFEAGHRIGLYISASEDGWYHPGTTNTTVEITDVQLDLPLLTLERGDDTYLEGDTSNASVSFPIQLDQSMAQDAEVEGAIPPARRGAASSAPSAEPAPAPAAPAAEPSSAPLPATGGGLAIGALVALTVSAAARRRH